MSQRQVVKWGLVVSIVMSLLAGCADASPTPVVILPAAATSAPAQPIPPAALPAATDAPATATVPPTATGSGSTTTELTTPEGTATVGTVPPTTDPIEQPFLMQIERVSVIVGRGTLLEGRVVHGTLQANTGVEILGPQNQLLGTSALAVLIANAVRDQVTVGDRAGVLVQSVEATGVAPGMLLAEAGAYSSYEQALEQIQ